MPTIRQRRLTEFHYRRCAKRADPDLSDRVQPACAAHTSFPSEIVLTAPLLQPLLRQRLPLRLGRKRNDEEPHDKRHRGKGNREPQRMRLQHRRA